MKLTTAQTKMLKHLSESDLWFEIGRTTRNWVFIDTGETARKSTFNALRRLQMVESLRDGNGTYQVGRLTNYGKQIVRRL